jgi:hypothetical protein
MKVPFKVTYNPFRRRARVQLSAIGIDDQLQIGWEIREGGLVDLVCMSTLPNLHRRPNLWVQLDGRPTDMNTD